MNVQAIKVECMAEVITPYHDSLHHCIYSMKATVAAYQQSYGDLDSTAVLVVIFFSSLISFISDSDFLSPSFFRIKLILVFHVTAQIHRGQQTRGAPGPAAFSHMIWLVFFFVFPVRLSALFVAR